MGNGFFDRLIRVMKLTLPPWIILPLLPRVLQALTTNHRPLTTRFLFVSLLILPSFLFSQVVADFDMPDTICVNRPVNVTNLSTGNIYTTYWSFCSGNTAMDPEGSQLQFPSGLLARPAYITVAQDGSECFSFITDQWKKAVIRFYHGTSFGNNPLLTSTISLPSVTDSIQGIQIKRDNGNWYGFVLDDSQILRMDFGSSLSNTPSITTMGPFNGVSALHGLSIVQQDAQHWYGIASSSVGNKIYLLSFGSSLSGTPTLTNITGTATFNHPGPLSLVQEAGNFYCFAVNSWNSTLSRGSFGSSLSNPPAWTNLGKVCISDAMGIMLIRDCEQTNGFMSRYAYSIKPDLLFRLKMPQGITGPMSTVSMGNIGDLDRPQQFSELARVKDTVYTFICNQPTISITRLSFVTCNNSSIPSSSLFNPPPFTYDSVGIYNVRLTINEGLPDQQNICKNIVVVDPAPVNLGPDRVMCQGTYGYLDAGPNCDTVRWNTGDTVRRIRITQAGTYWVDVHKFGCWGTDTVKLTLYPYIPVSIQPDTTICQGEQYLLDPGNNLDTVRWSTGDSSKTLAVSLPGQYWVHTVDTNGCKSADTVNISLKPAIPVNLTPDTSICGKTSIQLRVSVPGATYEWVDGSTGQEMTVTAPGIYWVRVSRDSCAVRDSCNVLDCAGSLYFPTAFSPNNDGVNDDFHPLGPAVSNFTLYIYDRWGQLIFQTNDQETGWNGTSKGNECPMGNYSFVAIFELSTSPGTKNKVRGTVNLLR